MVAGRGMGWLPAAHGSCVLLHVLNDNASHVGHLHIVREHLDGGVWDHAKNRTSIPVDWNGS